MCVGVVGVSKTDLQHIGHLGSFAVSLQLAMLLEWRVDSSQEKGLTSMFRPAKVLPQLNILFLDALGNSMLMVYIQLYLMLIEGTCGCS